MRLYRQNFNSKQANANKQAYTSNYAYNDCTNIKYCELRKIAPDAPHLEDKPYTTTQLQV